MVVAYNDIINAIARAEDVALYNARARAIELSNGCKPSKEDDDKAIEIESWIQLLTRAAANYDHETCLTDDIIWDIIQNVNEQNRDVDCDVSRTYSRNASSGGGSNVPSGYVERVLGLYVDNTNPSLPIIEIFVDPLTISGDGTQADPFSAIGGGSQTLAQTLILGNLSGANDIVFDATYGLEFDNLSRLREGTIDAGLGGLKGIAQICGAGYELKWENGRLYVMEQNGVTIRQSLYNFTTTPTSNEDTTKGYAIGSLWTLDDGTTYECTDDTIGSAVWVNRGNAFIVEIGFANLAALETAGTLSLTTIYIVTDATYRIALQAEAANKIGANGTIIDLTYSGSVYYDLATNTIVNGTMSDIGGNIFNGCLPTDVILGADCFNNTFGQGANGFTFGDDLKNVTIEAGITGADYSNTTTYAFLYNKTYSSTIFQSGGINYHRYFDIANDRIEITDLATPANITYIGGGASLDLEVNGTPNVNQTLLNLIEGINIDIADNGTGGVTITSLADRYSTSSITSILIGNGPRTFTVDANLAYIPLQEVLIVYDPSNHMHATVTSYSGTTLVVDVKHNTGSGTFASWVINLDGVPVDAITGVGTVNEIAYFTAGQVIASLPVATYPSLTELSYVKGVTSDIQTQINGKQATLVSGTNIKTVEGSTLLGSTPIVVSREIQLACSDETTALTTGAAKVTFRAPRAMVITGVRASLTTAQTSGSIFTVDINESGTSILSTKLTIDNTEKTSTTAATPPVISDSAIADDAEITIDIDQVGDGTAKGLKVTILYTI